MSQDKIQKARELVLNYIANHTLSDKLNRAVNEVCKSRPTDPWLMLSDIVSDWTKDVPIIDRLVAKPSIDNNGNTSLQLQLFGRCSSSRPPRYLGMENVFIKSEENKQQKDDKSSAESMMKKVSEFLSPALRSIRIDEQYKIDQQLVKLYADGLTKESKKFCIIPTISSLIAVTASNHLRIPLYKYFGQLNGDKLDSMDYTLPNIMCELVKSKNNKLPSVYIVTTNHLRPMQRVSMLTEITKEFVQILESTKNENVCFDEDSGAVLTECDDLNELLEIVNNAVINCTKYKISTDVSLCLSFRNNPKFIEYDSENKEYAINGDKVYKGKEIIKYFGKLCETHKEIGYLEDPLDESDKEMYALLNEECNDKNIMLIGDKLYSSQMELIENGIESKWTSGVALSCLNIFTISNALSVSNMDVTLCMTDDCDSSYLVDLSVVCNASMMKLSLPNCGKSTRAYNRWLMLADELGAYEQYDDEEEDKTKSGDKDEEEDEIEILDDKDEEEEDDGDDVEKEEDLP